MEGGGAPIHPSIAPISFLLGTWRGEGEGGFPTINSFKYGEEIKFTHSGKPVIAYTQKTWKLASGEPMHAESGYWRPKLDGSIEVIIAQSTGLAEIQKGTYDAEKKIVKLQSELVGNASKSRKDVEGSLFVVKRRTQPRFQFIVMNRRSTENLVEDLLSDFEYEVQLPYLLYRNANQEVIGIWFYNPRECEEVAKLFSSRILNAFSKVPPKPKVFTNQSNEFQELESVPTSATIEGPLEPTSSTGTIADSSEEPLERFFSVCLSTLACSH